VTLLVVNKSVLYEKLKDIVGSENVTDKEIILESYMATTTGKFSVGKQEMPEEIKKPGFIVRARNTEEVQEVVRLANQYKVPIIPVGALTSTYYETVPMEGCIMMDFSRMNKIEIDEELMTATFEPGVTWSQAYLKMTPLGYMPSYQASPASVSIVGTTSQAGMHLPLDKQMGGGPHNVSYYSDLTIGLEVVLPTGKLLVTGSAALPGVKQHKARAYGPNLAHIFLGAQGTLGIITKQTLPLWRIPEARCMVQGNFKDENFKGLARASYRIFNDFYEGPIWAEQQWSIFDGTQEPFEWEYYVQLYGNKERVEFDRKFSERIIEEEGGVIIKHPRILEVETDWSPQLYEEMIYWRPRANSIAMQPSEISGVNLAGEADYQKTPELHDAALKILSRHGVRFNRIRKGLLRTDIRSGVQQFSLSYLYDLNDAEEVRKAKAINEEWTRTLPQIIGDPERLKSPAYRFAPSTAKELMPKLGEYYELLKNLKRMVDPNRIMNPGKLMDIESY
jgi:glycolate oxidase